MFLDRIGPGADLPRTFNVIIEVPGGGEPIKFAVPPKRLTRQFDQIGEFVRYTGGHASQIEQ